MKVKSQLRIPLLWLSITCVLAAFFTSACEVSDPETEREKVQLETWNSSQANSGYSFVQCSSSGYSALSLMNICGFKGNENTALTNYNWHTNCSGADCSTVSVIADYMLMDDLGAQQTMHIEAFDNAQFNNSPVASLQISGFDARKPASTDREELFLLPGEYYFRAYLTHDGAAALPYTLAGMDLVSDTPVGVLGALSGAKRVLVKPGSGETETVHIYIDQLFKKSQPAEDTQAKFRLQITLPSKTLVAQYRDVHILLLKQADLELVPSYDFKMSSNLLSESGEATEFVSPSITPGDYFVFAFVDANSNGYIDAGELGAFVQTDGKTAAVQIDKNHTKGLAAALATYGTTL